MTQILFVAYLNGDLGVAAQLKRNLPNVAISTIVLAELLYGARASARVEQNLQRIHQLLQVVEVANFNQAGAETYSQYFTKSILGTSVLNEWPHTIKLFKQA